MAARRGAGFQRRYLHSGRIRGRCYTVTGRCNSSHRLLELGEKGVYPSYTLKEALADLLMENKITLLFIQRGKPDQNAYVERFNRTVRHDWLDTHSFESIEHAQELATHWLWIYNNERPNIANKGLPPRYLLKAA